jgi:hypothetical protein
MAFARKPAVAGMFYPSDAHELRKMVRFFLDEADIEPAPERVAAIMVPHAGYVFSGATAAHAYKRIQGKKPKRVVLLGCSHRYRITTASVFTAGSFITPLGNFPVDDVFADRLAHEFSSEPVEPHLLEHALEVQLPFLAESIGLVPIVPVLFGGHGGDWHVRAGESLAHLLDREDLVIASTDLSHYLSQEEAEVIDRQSLEGMLQQDWCDFNDGIARGTYSMCGSSAVTAAMAFAMCAGARDWEILDYRTSAEASGDTTRVVGYASVSMEWPA